MSVFKYIILLYLRNPGFVFLSLVFILSLVASKILFHNGLKFYAEEILNLLFIVTLWLAFHLGILIKRQLATHRSHLLPRYKGRHMMIISLLYLFFILLIYFWEMGLRLNFVTTPQGYYGVYAVCFLVAAASTYLGYLSVGRILLYAYSFLLLASTQAMVIIDYLNQAQYFNFVLTISGILFILFLRYRWFHLKEEHFEYNYLLSWPPADLIQNQLKAERTFDKFLKSLRAIFGIKENTSPIPPYPHTRNIFLRAQHWDYTEQADFKVIFGLIVLMTPIYLLLTKNSTVFPNFYSNCYANFLLLAGAPVLVTLGVSYKNISSLGYDLLKPIKREQYILERGLVMFFYLVLYWSLISICFAIIPGLFYYSQELLTKKFLAYLVLTGASACLIFGWLAYLSCITQVGVLIINGIFLGTINLFEFYALPDLPWEGILILILLTFIGSLLLMRKAYVAWCEKEFY